MEEDINSGKVTMKKLPKKKVNNTPKRYSPLFRFTVSFSLTIIIVFGFIFVTTFLFTDTASAVKYFKEGNEYYSNGRYASALSCYEEAVSLDGSNVDYRLALASCYEATGNEAAVLKTIDDGVFSSPNEYRYPAFLIGYYVRTNKLVSAFAVADTISNASVKSKINDITPANVSISPSSTQSGKISEVTMSCDENCRIFYTLDGTDPSIFSSEYSDAVDISSYTDQLVVKAIAVSPDYQVSRISTVNYNFNDPSKKYDFTDEKIGKIVSKILDKSIKFITYSDLELITEIDETIYNIEDIDISSLDDLVNFKNLNTLVLINEQNIVGFSVYDFSQLTSLKSLTLTNCFVNDTVLSKICRNTGIVYLDLSRNFIGNISSISSMTSLNTLILDENTISSLTPLASCNSLVKLSVAENNIQSLNPIKSLTQLNYLNASGNNIASLSDLSSLTMLNTIEMSNNYISSVAALASLNNIKKLNVSGNSIVSISPLSVCNSIKDLDVSYNIITDFDSLSNNEFTSFVAVNCGIDDISDIASINTVTLDISNSSTDSPIGAMNTYTDLYALASNGSVRFLKLNNTMIQTLAPLSGHQSLDSVYCIRCANLSFDDFENTTGIKLVKK